MALPPSTRVPEAYAPGPETSASAVSWAAILVGAVAATALSLALMLLGSGLGFSSVSPWSDSSPSPTTVGVTAICWIIVQQWVSAGVGGYLAGRLRTKWTGIHTDEKLFRDTAHGFMAWGVATIFTAALLASTMSSIVASGVRAAASVTGGAAQAAAQTAAQASSQNASLLDPVAYFTDTLLRADRPEAAAGDARPEIGRILARGLRDGDVPAADRAYLAQVVSARTGLSQPDAQKRVDDVINQAKAAEAKVKEAADKARKAAATLSIALSLSLFVGAFIGAVTGAYGGRLRDEI